MKNFYLILLLIQLPIIFSLNAFAANAPVKLAITIDDLPAAGGNPVGETRSEVANRILDTLKKHQISKVYGFVNGSIVVNMDERSAILKKWKAAGHLVGNHTYSHPDLGKVTADAYIADIEKNETTLIDYADSIPELKVFRYPFLSEGDTLEKRNTIRAYLKKRNYAIAPVSVDFLDWDWMDAFIRCKNKNLPDELSKLRALYLRSAREQLLYSQRLRKEMYGAKAKFPFVLLIHFSQVTSTYLDDLLTAYEKMNVKFVPLSEALASDVYNEDTGFVNADGESFLPQVSTKRKLNIRTVYQPEGESKTLAGMCL